MLHNMITPEFGMEFLLIALLASFIGISINNFIRNQADRARNALHQQRIARFLETANEIEEATHRLTQEIPAEAMAEILQMASIADLFAIQAAIAKAKAATQRLEITHLKQINAIAQGIGLDGKKQSNDNNGNKTAQQNGNNAAQQNGENPEKAGKKLLGEMRARLQANGKNIEWKEMYELLQERHNIETAAAFAALSADQRAAIEAAL
jgi:flavin-binding protein dodecin